MALALAYEIVTNYRCELRPGKANSKRNKMTPSQPAICTHTRSRSREPRIPERVCFDEQKSLSKQPAVPAQELAVAGWRGLRLGGDGHLLSPHAPLAD